MRGFGLKALCTLDLHHEVRVTGMFGYPPGLRWIEILMGMIGFMILSIFLILLTLYLWFALREVVIVLNNYNVRPAERCHWSSCGVYHHDEADPLSGECLNPQVRKPFFDRRKKGGNQPGCRYSVQVREIKERRKPAENYLQEYLDISSTYQTSNILWRLVKIGGGISLWVLGAIGLNDFINVFF